MKTTHDQNGSAWGRAKWIMIVTLALTTLTAATGCDDLDSLVGLIGQAEQWTTGGGYGVENVPTWGGLANPWYTSSLGLPEMPGYYWSHQ